MHQYLQLVLRQWSHKIYLKYRQDQHDIYGRRKQQITFYFVFTFRLIINQIDSAKIRRQKHLKQTMKIYSLLWISPNSNADNTCKAAGCWPRRLERTATWTPPELCTNFANISRVNLRKMMQDLMAISIFLDLEYLLTQASRHNFKFSGSKFWETVLINLKCVF